MVKVAFDELDKVTVNRYEAVLMAAQLARQINSARLAQLERLGEDNVKIDGRKVTTLALTDLAEGKSKFRVRGESQ